MTNSPELPEGQVLRDGGPLDARERRELCDLFLRLGPDAPTLCEGWTTLDLAAHLVLREHFHRWPQDRIAREKVKGLPALVERLRRGAPPIPWRVPGLRGLLNGGEFFIHHEDVRRANGMTEHREDPGLEAMAWRMGGFIGRSLARKLRPYSLELRRPSGAPRHFGAGEGVVLIGEPTELLLYLSGRTGAAHIEAAGSPAALATLRKAHLGL